MKLLSVIQVDVLTAVEQCNAEVNLKSEARPLSPFLLLPLGAKPQDHLLMERDVNYLALPVVPLHSFISRC